MNGAAWISSTHRPMGFPEFVIVIASIMALNPLAMDMMLPALPNIGSAFHIVLANRPQEILSTFLIGFGVGQFVTNLQLRFPCRYGPTWKCYPRTPPQHRLPVDRSTLGPRPFQGRADLVGTSPRLESEKNHLRAAVAQTLRQSPPVAPASSPQAFRHRCIGLCEASPRWTNQETQRQRQ
jgi:hypothetical protein